MLLGFDSHHPGGMADNSPTFQCWGREFRWAQVPKGRLKPGAIRQPSLRDLSDCGKKNEYENIDFDRVVPVELEFAGG